MRTLTDHKLPGLNEAIEIIVLDEPGHGGACHDYNITINGETGFLKSFGIHFQNGPILEAGANGISGEALLAIVIDRLRSFQDGPFACHHNDIAMMHIESGLMWLQKRTRERIARGVEGTHQK